MLAPDKYKEMIRRIKPSLIAKGFSGKKGDTFYVERGGNIGLINFQKSSSTTAAKVLFTVNLGVYSTRLVAFFAPGREQSRPSVWDCHWRQRIGYLLPEKKDKWWAIDNATSMDQLAYELTPLLREQASSDILKVITDQALIELWLSGVSPGLGDLERLKNLSVLLKALGMDRQLDEVLPELRQVGGSVVELHIRRLLEWHPT